MEFTIPYFLFDSAIVNIALGAFLVLLIFLVFYWIAKFVLSVVTGG